MKALHHRVLAVGAIAAGALLAWPGAVWSQATALTAATAPAAPASAAAVLEARFLRLYPGIYTPREQALVRQYLADNAALQARGPIDVQRLVRGELPKATPGLGPVIRATDDWVRYFNTRSDPENPLRHDRAHAQRAGWPDILAMPSFAAHDDTFMVPYPPGARDTLLVSDLNHSLTALKPIIPGDTLYLVADARELIDLTPPEGSVYRTLAINTHGSIYNQRGEKVNEVVFRVTESIKLYRNPADAPKNPGFFDMWEAPDWLSRPTRVYTDADWVRIRGIWQREERRAELPRYWQDVVLGERPRETLDGPILASVSPVPPWGQGSGGSRTLKQELLDPVRAASLVRGQKDGIWRTRERSGYVPATPPQPAGYAGGPPPEAGAITTTDIHQDGEKRSPLVNYMGRDLALRHLGNWMGDAGWLRNIRWSIMDPRGHAALGKPVPTNPRAERFLHRVPELTGRYVSAHGLTQDVALVKSQVVAKAVRDGRFEVDLVWWIETLDGDIWQEGGATIELPSRP
ncbi:hypothetical protein [Aquabacterium sp. OR-4]|uniref:hypothetical protein n=1 Tax=Aquabacterium sp. OR-4 TaxID=2978127 RepID=UPI0028C82411|nr:hypothetical protein [Aquabacterium sp. OR-4]MDT7836984.1 hypothetical protein [Aquabacterium sp. OR-4]